MSVGKLPFKDSSIKHPLTNDLIKVGGSTYNRLMDEGHIKEYTNPQPQILDKRTRKEKREGKPIITTGTKLCCTETKCHLEGYMCCIHGDTRTLILAGKITYAFHPIYVDGIGKKFVVDYAWKNYCPDCVSKSRREQDVKDIRTVVIEGDEDSELVKGTSTIEVQH